MRPVFAAFAEELQNFLKHTTRINIDSDIFGATREARLCTIKL